VSTGERKKSADPMRNSFLLMKVRPTSVFVREQGEEVVSRVYEALNAVDLLLDKERGRRALMDAT
jgi:hypothetical protein